MSELGAEVRRDFFPVDPKKVPPFSAPKKAKKVPRRAATVLPQTCSGRANALKYPRTVGGSVFGIGTGLPGHEKRQL